VTIHPGPADSAKPRVSAERGAFARTLLHLWPYIWPSDRRDLKLRVFGAFVLLIGAKLATIATPFTFKWATDALTGQGTAPFAAGDWVVWALATPVTLTIAYGGMRILMAALTQ
jgi:ATP-binding cassette subfamily B protein